MIVDPTDDMVAITPAGKIAAQLFILPTGSEPTAELTRERFAGWVDLDEWEWAPTSETGA